MPRLPQPNGWPKGPQPEVCALCGRAVEHDQIFIADVEGLYGQPICVFHGELGTAPSYRDLRGADSAMQEALAEAVREEPFGDLPWWDDMGARYIMREDGIHYLYREDGRSGFRREKVAAAATVVSQGGMVAVTQDGLIGVTQPQ